MATHSDRIRLNGAPAPTLRWVYRTEHIETHALSRFSLQVGEGEFVSVMGPSGSGKTTLLNVAGLLDDFDNGNLRRAFEAAMNAPKKIRPGRLPTKDEWASIVKPSCSPSPGAPALPDKAGTGCHATGTQWADAVQSSNYWSSSTGPDNPAYAWSANLLDGNIHDNNKYTAAPSRGFPVADPRVEAPAVFPRATPEWTPNNNDRPVQRSSLGEV